VPWPLQKSFTALAFGLRSRDVAPNIWRGDCEAWSMAFYLSICARKRLSKSLFGFKAVLQYLQPCALVRTDEAAPK
jgi:hypothetical protein